MCKYHNMDNNMPKEIVNLWNVGRFWLLVGTKTFNQKDNTRADIANY